MKKWLVRRVVRLLEERGTILRSATPRPKILDLIRRLRPLKTHLIRLGPDRDGGYLVPDDLSGVAALFSPGVGRECGFERDCLQRGMAVFLADGTVGSAASLDFPSAFSFTKRNLGLNNDGDKVTLDAWVREKCPDKGDLILQMDIEGDEYLTLLNCSEELLHRFRIIVVEFHHLDELWNSQFYKFAACVFERLLGSHAVVHIHPNNNCGSTTFGGVDIPKVAEFTFYRRDRLSSHLPANSFPHPLDRPNVPGPDLVLPVGWYTDSQSE